MNVLCITSRMKLVNMTIRKMVRFSFIVTKNLTLMIKSLLKIPSSYRKKTNFFFNTKWQIQPTLLRYRFSTVDYDFASTISTYSHRCLYKYRCTRTYAHRRRLVTGTCTKPFRISQKLQCEIRAHRTGSPIRFLSTRIRGHLQTA